MKKTQQFLAELNLPTEHDYALKPNPAKQQIGQGYILDGVTTPPRVTLLNDLTRTLPSHLDGAHDRGDAFARQVKPQDLSSLYVTPRGRNRTDATAPGVRSR
jgi:hypothetical protein